MALLAVFAATASADVAVIADERFDMTELPDDAVSSPWTRLGGAPAFLSADGTLVINDNSTSDKIAFQALLGEVEADHRVVLSGRVKVLANEQGDAVTLEVARPGLEAVVRLFADRIELAERRAEGQMRWHGSAPVDLTGFHEISLEKASRAADAHETLSVSVDGQVVLTARPRAEGQLGVGRLVVGSLSYVATGASQWDWWAYRVERDTGQLAAEVTTMGALKSRYR